MSDDTLFFRVLVTSQQQEWARVTDRLADCNAVVAWNAIPVDTFSDADLTKVADTFPALRGVMLRGRLASVLRNPKVLDIIVRCLVAGGVSVGESMIKEPWMSRPSEVYVRPLSAEEEQWVHRLYQQTTHVGLKSRCHIILLSTQHYSVPQIATLLFSSEDTVARCIHDFNWSGLEGILPQERVRRPVKITEEFLKKLLELVECDPRDLNYPFSTWTAELLALALKEQTGLVVSESSVRRSLHRHGYSIQRPVRIASVVPIPNMSRNVFPCTNCNSVP